MRPRRAIREGGGTQKCRQLHTKCVVVAVVVKLLKRNPHFEAKCKNYLGESVVVESCCWPGGRFARYVFYLDNIQVLDESARIIEARAIGTGTLCQQ